MGALAQQEPMARSPKPGERPLVPPKAYTYEGCTRLLSLQATVRQRRISRL